MRQAFAAIAIVSVMPGCRGLSEVQQYELASNAHTTAVRAMTIRNEEGSITLDQFRDFVALAEVSNALLDQRGADIAAGRRDLRTIELMNNAIDALVRARLEAEYGPR